MVERAHVGVGDGSPRLQDAALPLRRCLPGDDRQQRRATPHPRVFPRGRRAPHPRPRRRRRREDAIRRRHLGVGGAPEHSEDGRAVHRRIDPGRGGGRAAPPLAPRQCVHRRLAGRKDGDGSRGRSLRRPGGGVAPHPLTGHRVLGARRRARVRRHRTVAARKRFDQANCAGLVVQPTDSRGGDRAGGPAAPPVAPAGGGTRCVRLLRHGALRRQGSVDRALPPATRRA